MGPYPIYWEYATGLLFIKKNNKYKYIRMLNNYRRVVFRFGPLIALLLSDAAVQDQKMNGRATSLNAIENPAIHMRAA